MQDGYHELPSDRTPADGIHTVAYHTVRAPC